MTKNPHTGQPLRIPVEWFDESSRIAEEILLAQFALIDWHRTGDNQTFEAALLKFEQSVGQLRQFYNRMRG